MFTVGLFLFAYKNKIQAQDKIHLKDGTEVSCHITEIQDFILYAEVDDDPFLATFFADDVSHLDINPNNRLIIRELKQGLKEAMFFSKDVISKKGFFISKIFMGSTFNEIVALGKKIFKEVKVFKPKSSRKDSKESFIICKNLR